MTSSLLVKNNFYCCRKNDCWKVETLWKLSKDLQPFNRDISLFEKDLDKDP